MSMLTLLIARFSTMTTRAASPDPRLLARVSLDDQMRRLDGLMSASLERTAQSCRLHTAAEDQLDAASYALRELMKDLSAVMSIPPLRTGAELYRMPMPQPVSGTRLARRRVSAAA